MPSLKIRQNGAWVQGVKKVRQGGEWVVPTAKVRDGGEWVVYNGAILDDFEHNDVPGHYTTDGAGSATAETHAAYRGDYGLDVQSFQEAWSNPGDGLNYYDREEGLWFELWMNPRDWDSNEQYWVALGDRYTDGWDDHYEIRCVSDGAFFLVRRENGSTTTIANDDATAVNWQTNHWYRITGVIRTDEIRARLYDDSGTRLENLQVAEDTTRFAPPFKHGFRASRGGGVFFDELRTNPELEA